jgi:hypothetical protein
MENADNDAPRAFVEVVFITRRSDYRIVGNHIERGARMKPLRVAIPADELQKAIGQLQAIQNAITANNEPEEQ